MPPSIHHDALDLLANIVRGCRVDYPAFSTKLKPCDLQECKATCCHDGVYLSQEEAENIKVLVDSHREELFSMGFDVESPWLEKASERTGLKTKAISFHSDSTSSPEVDHFADDFPAHFPKTRCVFLDAEHKCQLQKLALSHDKDPWFYKPLTCWIHPLVILPPADAKSTHGQDNHTLTIVKRGDDPQKKGDYAGYASCTHCGRENSKGEPASIVLRPELKRLSEISRRDILAEIDAPEVDWYGDA